MSERYSWVLILLLMTSGQSVAVGLDFSNTPMFVSEVVKPNVIITPVYRNNSNEASMVDYPISDYTHRQELVGIPGCTSFFGSTQAECVRNGKWASSRTTPILLYENLLRVTPWPGEFEVPATTSCPNAVKPECPGVAGSSYVCSDIELFPGDVTLNSSPNLVSNSPLRFNVSDSCVYGYPGSTYPDALGLVQEIYPNATVTDPRYDVAKSRYFRSDSNFLYFNPVAANAGAYKAWPSLGGAEYPGYTAANSNHASFSPLPSGQDAGKIYLDRQVDNFMTKVSGSLVPNPLVSVINNPAYVGQYWVKTGSLVVLPGSYAGYCWEQDTDTTNIGCTGYMSESDRINFANWFTYWRSAGLVARGMMGVIFDKLWQADMLDKFRFGISVKEAGVRKIKPDTGAAFYSADFSIVDKTARDADLLAKIRGVIYSENYAFDNAWDYALAHTKISNESAYQEADNTVRGCRRNYEILLTPDYSNLTYAGTGSPYAPQVATNEDSGGGVIAPPYPDAYSGSWGDVGALGWKTDWSDLDNNLLPASTNPATHQHLVRYLIGPRVVLPDNESQNFFGNGVLSQQEAATIAQTVTTSSLWPDPNPTCFGDICFDQNLYRFATTNTDLWHMALNSHGFFYPSANVSDAVDNIMRTFNEILARNISGSSVATNTTSLQQGGAIYQATVETGWRGHLRAYAVNANDAGTALEIDYSSPVWDLANKLTLQADLNSRNVITAWNGAGLAFSWSELGSDAKTSLLQGKPNTLKSGDSTVAYGEKVVAYLRGDKTCEEGSSTQCVYTNTSDQSVSFSFRRRNLQRGNNSVYSDANPNGRNVLGDVANSNPWLTLPPTAALSDVDYPGYNQHRNSYANRKSVLYVGANDGMLHAVDAGTDTSTYGKELFAFIPSFVYGDLYRLADSGYTHRYYTDGSPFSADAFIGNAWKTVLAGGANKGGKGYYMLNVSDPQEFTEDNAADIVMWEFDSSDDADLHYTFNMPVPMANGQARQIRKMKNGQWAMFVGNGYPDADAKKACLFVIYVSGPNAGTKVWTENTHYLKSCVGAVSYSLDGGKNTNGMSTPNPVDEDNDGSVDKVYVGDVNGNLWRFDLSVVSGANVLTPAFSETPLFVAKQGSKRQPIVAPPEVSSFISGSKSGKLILFGTGKFIENDDSTNTDVQSFYAVWDRDWSGLTPSDLLPRTIVETGSKRTQSSATIATTLYYCDTVSESASKTSCAIPDDEVTDKYLGWYWNMPTAGERLTGRVNLINETVMFNTFFPSVDPCEYGGDGWLMEFNATTGLQESVAIFDMDQDGTVEPTEVGAGFKVGAAIGGTTFARGLAGKRQGIYSPTNLGTHADEGRKMTMVVNSGDGTTGRVSWYELMD